MEGKVSEWRAKVSEQRWRAKVSEWRWRAKVSRWRRVEGQVSEWRSRVIGRGQGLASQEGLGLGYCTFFCKYCRGLIAGGWPVGVVSNRGLNR